VWVSVTAESGESGMLTQSVEEESIEIIISEHCLVSKKSLYFLSAEINSFYLLYKSIHIERGWPVTVTLFLEYCTCSLFYALGSANHIPLYHITI